MPAPRVDTFSAGRTKCKSPMYLDKNMVEQSSTALFLSQSKRDLVDPRSSFKFNF